MAIVVKDALGKTLKTAGRGAPGAPGAAGKDGKSAYQYAVDGGYTGTEAEFQALMGSGPWVPYNVFNNIVPEIGSISNIISGNYVGTGASTYTINIGFSPKVVFVASYSIYSYDIDVGIFVYNCRGLRINLTSTLIGSVVPADWTSESGITIGDISENIYFNSPGVTYNFVALA